MTLPTKGPVLAVLACIAMLLGSANGCSKPAGKVREAPVEPATTTSESTKTRELEEKAAGYEERFREIQASDATAEEKAQAAGELVDEQQRTAHEAEDGGGGGDTDPQP
ncbi:MAG: hypothetical protein ABIV06_09690 [Thermoanaerobaculia bacterium]